MCFLQIENMDALFEAQFSPLADSGRLLSKCGKCGRYMKYISTQPMRLYCITCEDVYYLPQNGSIKVIILVSYIGNLPLFYFFLNELLYFHAWRHHRDALAYLYRQTPPITREILVRLSPAASLFDSLF